MEICKAVCVSSKTLDITTNTTWIYPGFRRVYIVDYNTCSVLFFCARFLLRFVVFLFLGFSGFWFAPLLSVALRFSQAFAVITVHQLWVLLPLAMHGSKYHWPPNMYISKRSYGINNKEHWCLLEVYLYLKFCVLCGLLVQGYREEIHNFFNIIRLNFILCSCCVCHFGR